MDNKYYRGLGSADGLQGNLKALPAINEIKVSQPAQIISIKDIPFADLEIPEYQRPYKWGVKNVNQLINDLLTFSKSREYRLGTLVLNDNKIVDGQQRIVTLSLLLYALFQRPDISKDNPYQELQDNVNVFWRRTKFKNVYSIGHVRENLSAIFERREDLTNELLMFLVERCEFVVVRLKDIGEAFQYFDSQNARGKDLEPHDLLKAFHLREIERFDKNDGKNIDDWQAMDTKKLAMLFLSMFRVKRWAKSNSGRKFTKDDVDVFKGISLVGRRFPYYMQQIICNYFADIYQSSPSRKVDRATLEFPFQLDQVCVNGSRFFDMVRHYQKLYSEITCPDTFKNYEFKEDGSKVSGVSAYEIITLLNTYNLNCRKRTGDQFLRQLFDCQLMYYVDRFGCSDEINKVVRKLFLCAYSIRIEHWSVQLATVDNDAVSGTMFKTIRDAKTPYDIINWSIRDINLANNSKGEILDMYNKILGNE